MSTKTVLMCPPTYFEVAYEINEWMHIDNPVDVALAKQQWQSVHDTYTELGYTVEIIEPVRGLPDMVFTANGALVIEGRVFSTNYGQYARERQPETPLFEAWFKDHGYKEIYTPKHESEGEGDILYARNTIFAGHGQRRSGKASHPELAAFFSKEVVSMHLIDPRFYHLDTAMCPLDSETVMYYPGAFDEAGNKELEARFPNRIIATEEDAAGFGLNAVSDGHNVVMSKAATDLIAQLEARGYNPIGKDMTEFRKSGGAVKCCTLELRR
jgi:N-dimethylarginine dimethylaminohydrolase